MSVLGALRERGAHFVLCRGDKRPLAREWRKKRPGFEAVKRHSAAGGLIGVVPASLDCVVVDVDEGGAAGVEALRGVLGEPIVAIRTRSGGYHVWHRAEGAAKSATGSGRWMLLACGGDIRGSNGFVVLWNPVAVVDGIAANFVAASSPSLHALRLPSRDGKRGPEAMRAAKPGARNDTSTRRRFWPPSAATWRRPR